VERLPDKQGIAKMLQPFLRRGFIAAMALSASVALGAELSPVLAQSTIAVSAQQVSRSVKVGLNKSLVIDLPRDARDILVSNPVIADAVIRTPRRIYVTGVAVGQSNVIIFDQAGQQIVTLDLQVERDSSNLSQMLARLIPDSDIQVEVVNDNIVLTGTVKNAADSQKAQDIANIFANGGANAQPGSTSTSTSSGGGSSGSSAGNVSISLSTSQQAPTSSVINMLTIQGEEQVQIKVTVAEVQRSIVKQLGIDWNAQNISIGGVLLGAVTSLPYAVTGHAPGNALNGTWVQNYATDSIGNSTTGDPIWAQRKLGATISALNQTGLFRTLAEPTLTAISGENASFLAGGEFPVPTGRDQNGNVTIQFKPYGVALSFTPVVLSEGRISLRVKTEVSELSQEGAVQLSDISIPSLKVRRAATTLELPSGGSMVLGGLLQDSARQSIAALPGLGKLPFLGPLFRSRDFQRGETELVIIATPYLVKPVPRSALATPGQGLAPASDAQSIFLGNLNRVYGVKGRSAPGASYQYSGKFGFIFE
jgi:pilus assembly protein CpaC